MALAISIITTGGVDVPDDVAADFAEVASLLETLPSNRAATVEFGTPEEARYFVRQARTWGDLNGYVFKRRNKAADEPTTVVFRLYKPKQ